MLFLSLHVSKFFLVFRMFCEFICWGLGNGMVCTMESCFEGPSRVRCKVAKQLVCLFLCAFETDDSKLTHTSGW